MNGRTWKNLSSDSLQKIYSQLLANGGKDIAIKNPHESWRLKIDDSIFIAFKKGTLYHTPSNSDSPEVMAACEKIDSINERGYSETQKDYLIGLDETGKGEIAGPIVLVGVILPKRLFKDFVNHIGTADTKKQHRVEYWDELFQKLTEYRNKGFYFATEKISPIVFDKYNVNRLLDIFYERIILKLLKIASPKTCRIVLDDYGAGKFTDISKENEFLILTKAEDNYIEAKAASLISKKIREGILNYLNQLHEYKIDGLSIGQGNVGNPQTTEWLRKWKATKREWPWFIKKSFKTITILENKTNQGKKNNPEIKNELLPTEFVHAFKKHQSFLELLQIKCVHCNEYQKVLIYDYQHITCESCLKTIGDLHLTLRYYCGTILIDSEMVEQQALIKDLKRNAFFENYKVFIPRPDSQNQRTNFHNGLNELKRLELMGRLDLEYFNLDQKQDSNLNLIEKATTSNAIIVTSNLELKNVAKEKNLFTLLLNQRKN
jgi:ribonuclease HII